MAARRGVVVVAGCVGLAFLMAGCVTYEETRTERRTPQAPVREMVGAAAAFYVENERWPDTPEELDGYSGERSGTFSADEFSELEFTPAPGDTLDVRWATEPPSALEGRVTLQPPSMPEDEDGEHERGPLESGGPWIRP